MASDEPRIVDVGNRVIEVERVFRPLPNERFLLAYAPRELPGCFVRARIIDNHYLLDSHDTSPDSWRGIEDMGNELQVDTRLRERLVEYIETYDTHLRETAPKFKPIRHTTGIEVRFPEWEGINFTKEYSQMVRESLTE